MTADETPATDAPDGTAAESVRSTGSASASPDVLYAVVVGLYAAALVAPLLAAAVGVGVGADPGGVFLALLAGVAGVATLAGYLVARSPGFAVRVGGSWLASAAMVAPFAYLAPLVADVATGAVSVPPAVVLLSLLGAVSGLFLGIGVMAASHNRHAAATLVGATTDAEWAAPWPRRRRRAGRAAAVGLVVLGGAGLVGSTLVALDPLRWLFQSLVPLGAVLFVATNGRTYRATDAGLVSVAPVHRRTRPWSSFSAFSVDGDALVVHRPGLSPAVRCDLSAVEDRGAVREALARYLPEREG